MAFGNISLIVAKDICTPLAGRRNYFNIMWGCSLMFAAGEREVIRMVGGPTGDRCISTKKSLSESLMTVIGREGEVLECGRAVKEVFGLGAGELVGRDWFDIFISGDCDALKTEIAVLKNYSAFTFIADYKARVFRWSGFVFTREDKARRVVLIAEDITDCQESVLQLERYMVDLERMTRAQSSRELRMGEMRRKIKELEASLVYCKDRVEA